MPSTPGTRTARVVVVGADAAGMSAAHQAMRGASARHREVDIVVLEQTQHTSYSACGIPYWIAGDVAQSDNLVARTVDQHRSMGLDLRVGATATAIDLKTRTVHYRDETGDTFRAPFDDLVLATGAAPVIPDWARDSAGDLISGVLPVKRLDDGDAWIALLQATQPNTARRAVVVGGGFIAVEMAEALLRHRVPVTLITRTHVMSSLDPDMSSRIVAGLTAAGVTVWTDTQVSHVDTHADGRVRAVTTTDGRTVPADLVVIGVGVRPVSQLGAEAGVATGASGGYLPDARGHLGDGIWAAGDCCETRHRITDTPAYLPLGTHANKQGRVVGENLSGGDARFGGVLGTAITRFVAAGQHIEIARTGLSTAEADRAGLRTTGLTTESHTASSYMPEATPIATKILAEPGSNHLVGVQIVGGPNAGKRIDTAAAALWGRMTVNDLAGMDLAYAPPFATAWEAVQIAARRLADQL